jgi:hypothetical protein
MTDAVSNKLSNIDRNDDAVHVRHALSEIFERPLRIAKPVDVVTPDMQADVADAGQLAIALMRKSLSSPSARLSVLHALDGLSRQDRTPQYKSNTDAVFQQMTDPDGEPTVVKPYRVPDFVAALPVPARDLRKMAGADISALPPHLAGAMNMDGKDVLLSANLGMREHYITAQCMTTVHLVDHLSANGIDAAQGNVLTRVHQVMFGQDFGAVTEGGYGPALPVQDVLCKGTIRKAQTLELV